MISQDIHGKGGCGLPCGYDCNGACFAPPADAKAVLEAYGREKLREGMMRAADIALCHSDDRPRRYSMDWNDGYIDGCKGASDAILDEM